MWREVVAPSSRLPDQMLPMALGHQPLSWVISKIRGRLKSLGPSSRKSTSKATNYEVLSIRRHFSCSCTTSSVPGDARDYKRVVDNLIINVCLLINGLPICHSVFNVVFRGLFVGLLRSVRSGGANEALSSPAF